MTVHTPPNDNQEPAASTDIEGREQFSGVSSPQNERDVNQRGAEENAQTKALVVVDSNTTIENEKKKTSSPGFWTKVWRSFFGVARRPSVLARLSLEERSRALLDDSTLRILHNSFRLAEESMHRAVRHEHLLRLLFEHPDVHKLLTDIGVEVDILISEIQKRVAQLPVVVSENHIALAEPSLLRAVHRSMVFVLGTHQDKVRPVDLFLAVMAEIEPSLNVLLQEFGCRRFQVVLFLSHGVSTLSLKFDDVPEGTVKVVMHNDNYTTQEWVVYVLHEKFGLDGAEARGFMLEIHNHGQATVTNLEKREAILLVREILDESSAAGMPLKISLSSAY
ncbi:MAG: hypothetical protein GY822_16365 [Deltaproteobacteria bacterium]|nr:hypothetical protein [Deltaproteobacteria bacterium]